MKQVLATVLLLVLAPGSWAADSTWNVTSGSWHTAGNWSPSGVPGSGTFVLLGTTSSNRTANITSANAFSQGANIGVNSGNVGTLNLLNGRTWTNNTYNIIVGTNGTGTLNIQSGGKAVSDLGAVIGYNGGSTGFMTVTGTGSQ